MKKITFIITILLTSIFAQAQKSPFDSFENNDEVTTVVINKKAFLLLKKLSAESAEAAEYRDLINGLDELKVYTTEDTKTAAQMQATFNAYIQNKKLVELMRIKDKDANVKIYIMEGKTDDFITEFVMLVDEMNVSLDAHNGNRKPEVIIVSLTGNINLKDVAKLTADMNIPGNEHIKQVGEK